MKYDIIYGLIIYLFITFAKNVMFLLWMDTMNRVDQNLMTWFPWTMEVGWSIGQEWTHYCMVGLGIFAVANSSTNVSLYSTIAYFLNLSRWQ